MQFLRSAVSQSSDVSHGQIWSSCFKITISSSQSSSLLSLSSRFIIKLLHLVNDLTFNNVISYSFNSWNLLFISKLLHCQMKLVVKEGYVKSTHVDKMSHVCRTFVFTLQLTFFYVILRLALVNMKQ